MLAPHSQGYHPYPPYTQPGAASVAVRAGFTFAFLRFVLYPTILALTAIGFLTYMAGGFAVLAYVVAHM